MGKYLNFRHIIYLLLVSAGILCSCSRNDPASDLSFPAKKVLSLYIDKTGIVWAGTDAGIISYFQGKWKTYEDVQKLPSGQVNDIAFQSEGDVSEIWMATSAGAAVLKYSAASVTSATSYSAEQSGLSDNSINAVITYGTDSRWFATRQGLNLFLGSKWYTETAYGDLIMSPAISLGSQSDGWIFAGTNGLGVGRFRYEAGIDGITGASYYNTDWSGLPSDTVLCVYIDKDNHQWFGTPKGVAFHSDWATKIGWKVYTVADGLVNNRVQAICGESIGMMWFGTTTGVSSFDGQNWKTYTSASGLINQSVNDIVVDNRGTVWIATNGGISTFDGISWKSYSR